MRISIFILVSIAIAVFGSSPSTAADFDTDLRGRLQSYVGSEEFDRAEAAGDVANRMGRILQATIRDHTAELPRLVKKDLDALPQLTELELPELVSATASDFFDLGEVKEASREQGQLSERGAALFSMLFLPSRAALEGVQAFRARVNGPLKYSKGSVVAHLAPPKLSCLKHDLTAPVIAVDALDGVFVVELVSVGDGLFVPTRIERRKPNAQDSAANGSQPISSQTNRTPSAAGSRR
jgi:hypothetical protein